MSEGLSGLRAEAERIFKESRPTRTRYPAEFRARAVAAAHEQLERGKTVERAAAELGLRARTLQKWLAQEPRGAWRRVVVESEAPAACSGGQPVVVLGKIRVEGLDLAGVAQLLRILS